MAKVSFRQGIVQHGKSPSQSFFLQQNGNDVDLLISPIFTTVAIADGASDYLFTESVTVNNAWADLSIPSQDYWIYWDIDKVSGERTFGKTTFEPVYDTVAPSSPVATGQMWFNTTPVSTDPANGQRMYEWNGVAWVHVLRVFAAKVNNFQFFSPVDGVSLETNFIGTQIGASGNVTRDIGAITFDVVNGNPIYKSDGSFFTTEDVFVTGVPDGSSLKVNNILVPAYANEPIAAYQLVVFDDYDQISLATTFLKVDKIYGLVNTGLNTGDVGNVITKGLVYNPDWDFTDAINNPSMNGDINDPIYPRANGDLTTEIGLSIPGQVAVGAIVGRQTILFSPGIYGTIDVPPAQSHGDLSDLGVDDHTQYFNEARGDARYYEQSVADTLFADAVHTHVKADITDFAHTHVEADITDLDKYTQAEADSLFVDAAGDTMTGYLTLNADPTAALHAVTKQYADGLATGVNAKAPCAVGTTSDIGGTYLTSASSPVSTGQFIDVDVTALDGAVGVDYDFTLTSRVLVKDQTDAKQNGIYEITDISNPLLAVLERAADHNGDPAAEVSPGNFTLVTGGLTQAGSGWIITGGTATGTNGEIVLNTDDINWTQFYTLPAYTAGDNIDISASNVISVIDADSGGTVDALTWNSNAIALSSVQTNDILIYQGGIPHWTNQTLTLDFISDVNFVSGSPGEVDGNVLTYSGGTWTNAPAAATGLQNVVEDLTPQLGGDLDVNGFNIFSIDNAAAQDTEKLRFNGGNNTYLGGGYYAGGAYFQGGVGTNGNNGGPMTFIGGTATGLGGYGGYAWLQAGNGGTGSPAYGAGGTVYVYAGNTNANGYFGGNIVLKSGNSVGTSGGGDAGDISLTGGDATYDATANGGGVTLFAGDGGDRGGSVGMYGGIGTATAGGYARVHGGTGPIGGGVSLRTGTPTSGGTSAGIEILSLGSTASGGSSGNITVTAQSGSAVDATGTGGDISLTAGNAGQYPGDVKITAGGVNAAGGLVNGGYVSIRSGAGLANGGDVFLDTGPGGAGTGNSGSVFVRPGEGFFAGGKEPGLDIEGRSNTGGAVGHMRLWYHQDSGHTVGNYVELKASTSLSTGSPITPVSFTLPAADGTTGQVLITDGSGTLSFANAGAGALGDLTDVDLTGSPAPSNGDVLTYVAGSPSYWTHAPAAGGGLTAVVDDPSPQLGGDLDTNGYNIITADVSADANSDAIIIRTGTSTYAGGTRDSGALTIGTGNAYNGNDAGNINITGGTGVSGTTSSGGDIFIRGGSVTASAASGYGGRVSVYGGNIRNSSGGFGGQVLIRAGSSYGSVDGAKLTLNGGSILGSGTGNGGDVEVIAGFGASGKVGGDVLLIPGGGTIGGSVGHIEVHTGQTQLGEGAIQIWKHTNTAHTTGNYVDLKVQSTLASNVAFALPTSNGTDGQFLKTDGSGNTSWGDGRPQTEQITIGGSPVSDVVTTTVVVTASAKEGSPSPYYASIQVFRNGLLQREDLDGASPITGDFIVTGVNELTFAPGTLQPADEIIIYVFP